MALHVSSGSKEVLNQHDSHIMKPPEVLQPHPPPAHPRTNTHHRFLRRGVEIFYPDCAHDVEFTRRYLHKGPSEIPRDVPDIEAQNHVARRPDQPVAASSGLPPRIDVRPRPPLLVLPLDPASETLLT